MSQRASRAASPSRPPPILKHLELVTVHSGVRRWPVNPAGIRRRIAPLIIAQPGRHCHVPSSICQEASHFPFFHNRSNL